MGPGLISRPVANTIAVVIVAVWGASQVAPYFVPGFKADDGIHLALMAVLGFVFSLKERHHGDQDPDKPPGPPGSPPAAPPAGDQPAHTESAVQLIERLLREREGGPPRA